MGYRELYTDLGFNILDQIGKELIVVCPQCSKEDKFSISDISGLTHCFSCSYYLAKLILTIRPISASNSRRWPIRKIKKGN